jgi:glutathione S-transferase
MTPLVVQLIVSKLRERHMPFFARPIVRKIAGGIEDAFSKPGIDLHMGYVDNALKQRLYFAGEHFTAADIQMFYPLDVALSRIGGQWPRAQAWRERVTARAAYVRAAERIEYSTMR